jgi:hypothetical protein
MRARGTPLISCDETHVEIVDPEDGSRSVFRDACVLVRLSAPADPASLSSATFCIQDPAGVVPATLRLSPDRRILIWRADRPLVPGVEHVVQAQGVRDACGRPVAVHRSRFVPCDLASTDWPPD